MDSDTYAVLIVVIISIPILLAVTYALRKIIWAFNPIFFLINYIIWFFYNPLRFLYKNLSGEFPRRTHNFLLFTLISPLYVLIIHLVTTPLRLVNALYFDVLLYWSVMLDDTLNEVFRPKLGSYRHKKGFKYFIHWVFAFPWRMTRFVVTSVGVILDSILSFGISIMLPTLTMYHGTAFDKAAAKIGQSGKWKVGDGNYAGTGVYFGIQKKVGLHYASGGSDQGILIVRMTPIFARNTQTLKPNIRNLIGGDGDKLSESIKFPWSTIEYYRGTRSGWWEYCLAQPGEKRGSYIDSWRVRPVAVLKENQISRLWGGFSLYSTSISNITMGVICWVVIIIVLGAMESMGVRFW